MMGLEQVGPNKEHLQRATDFKNVRENALEDRREAKIETSIELKKFNPWQKDTEQWQQFEDFCHEELPKYEAFVNENAKKIIAELLHAGTQVTENPDYDGYKSFDILDQSGLVAHFDGGWVDAGDWDKGYAFHLSGFTPTQQTAAVKWIVKFEEK